MKKTKLPTSKAKTAYGLLSDICRIITEEPKRYDQSFWIYRPYGDNGASSYPDKGFPSCGTVACVAGWVATLKAPTRQFHAADTKGIAADVLGIDSMSASRLFDGAAIGFYPQTDTHAAAGVAHIRRFQKKYRAQLLAKKV